MINKKGDAEVNIYGISCSSGRITGIMGITLELLEFMELVPEFIWMELIGHNSKIGICYT